MSSSRLAAGMARRAAGITTIGNSNRLILRQQSSSSRTCGGGGGSAARGTVAALGAAAAISAAAGTALVVAEGGAGGGGGGGGGSPAETGGGAWGRRGMSQGKYYALKQGEAGVGETVQGEDDKFFDPDYEYLMVRVSTLLYIHSSSSHAVVLSSRRLLLRPCIRLRFARPHCSCVPSLLPVFGPSGYERSGSCCDSSAPVTKGGTMLVPVCA